MAIEIEEIKAFIGTKEDLKHLDKNSISSVLSDVVLYVSERLEKAFDDKISDLEDVQMHKLITMAVANIIINMLVPRISTNDKNKRNLVVYRYLDDLKTITLELYKEAEKQLVFHNETEH